MKHKIIVKQDNNYFQLGEYDFKEKLDGSFYLFLTRKGRLRKSWTYSLDKHDSEIKGVQEQTNPGSKSNKISYHSSGRINYQKDGKNILTTYADPIANIKTPFPICLYSVPSVTKLDKMQTDPKFDELIIELPTNIRGRINFSFTIAPWNTVAKEGVVTFSIKFIGLFSFYITVDQTTLPIPPKLKKTFVTAKLNKGLYEKQLISEHRATIDFQQRINKTKGPIMYSPNKEGVYKMFYAVPMRIPPRPSIQFIDSELRAEMIGKHTEAYLSFKVYKNIKSRDGIVRKQYFKTEQQLKNFELDAEL